MKHWNEKGSAILIGLSITIVFAIGIAAVISLRHSLYRPLSKTGASARAELLQKAIFDSVFDAGAWNQTLRNNGVPLPINGANPLTTPLTNPPAAPSTQTMSSGNTFDLYDAQGRALVRSNQPQAGFTLDGNECTSFSQENRDPQKTCSLRWELRWFVMNNASNPWIVVQANLLVDQTVEINPMRFSYNLDVSPPTKLKSNELSRPLYLSYQSLGLLPTGPNVQNPRLKYLDYSGLPGCEPNKLLGTVCYTPGDACICNSCLNGPEVYRCQ